MALHDYKIEAEGRPKHWKITWVIDGDDHEALYVTKGTKSKANALTEWIDLEENPKELGA